MSDKKSILVLGFNTRPLAFSLKQSGFDVYVVDFFGDIDLFPYVKDSIIITERLNSNYEALKEDFDIYLINFGLEMLKKYPNIDYFLIGSGLDDAINERRVFEEKINELGLKIKNTNNDLKIIEKARDINLIHKILKENDFPVPLTCNLENVDDLSFDFTFPIILKKKHSSGGISIKKIKNRTELKEEKWKMIKNKINLSDWLVQEYIEGIPVSCTFISNGIKSEIISINQQLIGEKVSNPPSNFFYCGNVVPAKISKKDKDLITKISLRLASELGLKGINGIDYVLRDHDPFFMEINPRIPGSIRASECSLNINLLDLHVKSFETFKWKNIVNHLKSISKIEYATKLIMYASKDLNELHLEQINNLKNVHDKTLPQKGAKKGDPVCTILNVDDDHDSSYKGALKIANKINLIMNESSY